MGNDGGSIPTRRELVKEAARNPTAQQVKETQQEQQGYLWTTDPVSQKPLVQPVVSDAYGTLYNKDTILEFLLDGTKADDIKRVSKGSIKTLKDVIEVKFNTSSPSGASQTWTCPVTGDRLGPGSKALYLVPCGHAFSGVAMKEVAGDKCTTCDTDYAPNDAIPIIPTSDTDIARLALRLQTLQEKGLSHSLKKVSSKKRKKDALETKESDAKVEAKSSNINSTATAALTAKVLEDQDNAKKRKLQSDNVKSLFTKENGSAKGHNGDFMTRGFSVPATR